MRLENYRKKTFEEFLGLYDRGSNEQVPSDHFSDSLNIDYGIREWKTRSGLSSAITLGYGSGSGTVARFASFIDPNITIILDGTGAKLYTFSTRTGDTATTARITVTGATDISAIKMLGKIYLAFHNGSLGLSGQNLKVFIPHSTTVASDEFRDAAGLAPSASNPIVAADGATGLINAGTYLISVAYETTSGFITKPGPEIGGVFTPTTDVAPGSKKINLSVIPTGPSGTAKRHILITKAGLSEYFFLGSDFGGIIADNTTTTTIINFDDTTDLVASADYLFDLLETIPAPLVLQDYAARLITGGENANPSILRASRPGEPESFDAVDGVINVSKDDGFQIRNLSIVRSVLYAWKNLGVFAIRDNGSVPSEWGKPNPIDQNVNTTVHGIGEFFDTSGIRMARDWTLVSDRSGILLFDGVVRKPPITDKINDIWQDINFDKYHRLVLVVDEQFHKIYCAIPTGSATENDKLLVGDYNSCLGKIPEYLEMKWTLWDLKPGGSVIKPTEIGLAFVDGLDTLPTLKIGTLSAGGGKIYALDPAQTSDDGTAIESYFETALLFWNQGMVHFFTAARLSVTGSGTLLATIRGKGNVLSGTLPSTTLASAPGVEQLIRFNFQNERARLKFRLTTGNFVVSKLEIFGRPVYSMRPA
jgi:hypothetical protein